jgi:hypothetical protein
MRWVRIRVKVKVSMNRRTRERQRQRDRQRGRQTERDRQRARARKRDRQTDKVNPAHLFLACTQIKTVEACIRKGLLECPEYPLETSLRIAETMDKVKSLTGIKYSADTFFGRLFGTK